LVQNIKTIPLEEIHWLCSKKESIFFSWY